MTLDLHQFGYDQDNYGVLLHDSESGETAMVDAGDAAAARAALATAGWQLTQIWITHHHGDHTAGLQDIAAETGAVIYGPAGVSGVTNTLSGGDSFVFAGRRVEVLATPGHTLDMLNYHLASESLAFTGDTLFAMGCGRLFEGNAEMMWESLTKLMALDDETIIYCSHEYTAANAAFALSVDPDNQALQRRAEAVAELRAAGQPTVPTIMALEKETNPFLRADDAAIRTVLGMESATDSAVFAEIRRRKDSF
ncbi:MAG: hydroxyacylglutathione hydrolase [Candidatus Puniceispirillaceae bacterium]|jgi:hydroxyacylglutathione hydrolase